MENQHKKKKNWNNKYLTSMKYQSFQRKHYNFSVINEKTYIIGYNWYEEEGFMPMEHLKLDENTNSIEEISKTIKDFYTKHFINYKTDELHKGLSILDSLISLRQKLNYTYYTNEYSVSSEELLCIERDLSNEDKKSILKWVETHGMPFLGEKVSNNNMTLGIPPFEYGFKNDFFTCFTEKSCICRLGSFLIALNILMKTFINYLVYAYRLGNLEELVFTDEDYDNYDKSEVTSYIRTSLSSISNKAIINLDEILDNNEIPRFEGCCETIISLAMYQLAIVASSKKINVAKMCSLCGNIFIPTRTTRCYCKTCSRQQKYKNKREEN